MGVVFILGELLYDRTFPDTPSIFKQYGVFVCPLVLPIKQLIVDLAPEYVHDDVWSYVYVYDPLVSFSSKIDNPLVH